MNDLKNKSTNNLKAVRTIGNLNGLYGLHDCIWDKFYKGTSELVFWMNGSFDLHKIVEYPNTIDRLIRVGEDRVFNFYESMYPLNIRKEAENGLVSAFQFWKLPKTKMRRDELLDDFLFRYKDVSNNPETTFDATNFGIVTMMKVIITLQRTILGCPEGIFNHDEFLDNAIMNLRSLNEEVTAY